MSFASFYNGLEKDSDGNVLRIFERKVSDGFYFTAHGVQAEYIADTFFNTRDVLKYAGEEGQKIAGCSLRPQKVTTILRHVLVEQKGHFDRVEIWAKTDQGPQFVLSKKGTPGNLSELEDLLFDGENLLQGGTVVMALKVTSTPDNQRLVGMAFADASLQTIDVCEFVDNDRFVNFESVVVQRGAKECLVAFGGSMTAADQRKVMGILDQCRVPVTERKAADFKAVDVEQDLSRLVGSLEQHLDKLDKKSAMSALSCLVKYMELLRDESTFGRFKLGTFDLSQYMKLDKSAVEALNLLPTANDSDKNMSLFGMLNKCRTATGGRLLMQWLKQPLLDLKVINRRLDYVELLVECSSMRSNLMDDNLRRVPDLDRMAKKFQKGKASLQTIVDFYKFSVCLPALGNTLREYEGKHVGMLQQDFIERLDGAVADLAQFEAMVEQTVDMDAVDRHEYLVNAAFDPRLEELKHQLDQLQLNVDSLLEDVADDLGLDSNKVKLSTAPNLGEHFRVSRADEKKLRGKSKYTTLDTRKDGVRFTTIKMKKFSREKTALQQNYGEIQKEIVSKAVEIATSYTPVMEQLNEILSELDVFVSFAHVACTAPSNYCRPQLSPLGSAQPMELIGSRHPCMEVLDGCSFIPNDVKMEPGKSNVQIITGPNMGGKSTYIRQIGVVCLMAQVGCFVPCDSASMPLVDCILARVGAGDSQLKGVSTFMKEMLEASHILKSATANSLIIIDELGRGTSTYDGFGLAWAIAEYIAKDINAFSLFATHFHELTALASAAPNVVNRHVTAHTDTGSITMLYQLRDGPCDRSFGIHVSELANFPPEVVSAAKRKAEELENFGNAAGMDLLAGGGKKMKPAISAGADMETDESEAVGKFLKSFTDLPLDKLDEQEARTELTKLADMVKGDTILSRVLASATDPV